MASVRTTYDGPQHCVAVKEPQMKRVAIDCPYTGKGEEFSPTHLVQAALAGCMLLSMGTLAMRHPELDINGTKVDVKITSTDKPVMRYQSIEVTVHMPRDFPEAHRSLLRKAADACPVKNSFDASIPVSVDFRFPEVIVDTHVST